MEAIPIRFNPEEKKDLDRLVELLGIKDTYGSYPKAIKLAIKLGIKEIEKQRREYKKCIQGLKKSEMALFLSSITETKESKK